MLHLPKAEGGFIIYSDTSIEGRPCLKLVLDTVLEMTGLLVSMNLWKNLLKHREFDAAVDHVAVAQIMRLKQNQQLQE